MSILSLLNTRWFYYFLLIPFFKPGYFETINSLDLLFNFWRVLSSVIIICIYVKNNKVSKFILYILLFQFVIICSTIINNGDIVRATMYSIMNLGICSLVEIGLYYNKKLFIDSLYKLLDLLVIINFIVFIIYPEGIYINSAGRGNFIDIDNLLAPVLMIAILISMINAYVNNRKMKVRYLITIIISSITIILIWPATAVAALFITLALIITNLIIKESYKILNIKINMIIYVSIFLGFTVFQIQNKFSFIIEGILGKSLTFSGRTIIWNHFFDLLKKSKMLMLIGNGIQAENVIYVSDFGQNIHLHNQIFNIILESGVIGLILFLIIIVKSSSKLYKYRNRKIAQILSAIMMGYLLIMLMEISRNPTIFICVLSLANSIKYLDTNQIKSNNA